MSDLGIARVRIRKVTFKSGGSVTLLRQETSSSRVTRTLRRFIGTALSDPDDQPIAFGAVAFFTDTPGAPRRNVAFVSASSEVPLTLLGHMVGTEITRGIVRAQVATDLGLNVHYNPDDEGA